MAMDSAEPADVLMQSVLAECSRLAGAQFRAMLRSSADSEQRLFDAHPSIRLAALKLGTFYWRPSTALCEASEKLALHDLDLAVREMAALALGVCYRRTCDARIGRLLASIVQEPAQPPQVRKGAYQSLFSVRGLLPPDVPKLRFPEDVDWEFVGSFFQNQELPSESERIRTQAPFLDEKTSNALAHKEMAERAVEQGNLNEALRQLSEVVKNLPGAGAYLLRAQCYLKLGRYDEAIQDFTQSLEMSPDSAKAHMGRSKAYRAKGMSAAADQDYEKSISLAKANSLDSGEFL